MGQCRNHFHSLHRKVCLLFHAFSTAWNLPSIRRGLWFAGQYRLAFDDDASDVDEQPQTLREILEEVSKGKYKVEKGKKSE